jgi:hypothetical protein
VSALRAEFADIEFAVVPRGWKCLSSALSLATGESCTLTYFRSAALSTRLLDRVRRGRYDAVYVSSSSMIQYALELPPAIPTVVDFGDVDSEWWRIQAGNPSLLRARFYRTEATRLRLAEAAIARRAAARVAASLQAADVVRGFLPGAPAIVIPDGVDTDHFSPVLRLPASPTVAVVSPLPGEAAVEEAARFCRAVVPAVQRVLPSARFVVVSREAAPGAWRLGQIPGVEVVSAEADTRPWLHRASVAIAPVASRTAPTGVLEALATALPVVGTSAGCQGLAAPSGRAVQVEDDTEAFADRLVELLQQPTLRAELGSQGRAFVRSQCAWAGAADRVGEVIHSVVAATEAPAALPSASTTGVAR